MFKRITITLIIISVILLIPLDSFAQGRGGMGGRGGTTTGRSCQWVSVI